MIQSTNEKNKLTGNYIEKSISSRKNSRNYCEVLSTPKRPNSHSKSNERAKILVHSEKKAKVVLLLRMQSNSTECSRCALFIY